MYISEYLCLYVAVVAMYVTFSHLRSKELTRMHKLCIATLFEGYN